MTKTNLYSQKKEKTAPVFYRVMGFMLLLLLAACKQEPVEPLNRTTFSYMQDIVNPPDDFLILFNNQPVGQKIARLTFTDNAVWYLERIGDLRGTVSIKKDTVFRNIDLTDSLGLYAGLQYEVVLNNVPYGESQDVYVGFKKLNKDFATFQPKF